MDFHIAREELVRALSRVQGIVERRSTNPIIANVLLTADETRGLVVAATDTEISFIGNYEATVEETGEITVEAKHLFDIARSLPTDKVTVKSAVDAPLELEIRSGKAFFRVKGMTSDNFPPIPKMASEDTLKIRASELRRLIERTSFSISSDDTRTGLNGACVEDRGDGKLRMVATDGHRLSLAEGDFEGSIDVSGSVLLPRKGLAELRKLCDDPAAVFEVSLVQNQVIFRRSGMSITMRLLEGTFPDYNQVIPDQPERVAIVSRRALGDGLKRVSILAAERSNAVRFTLGDGTLGLRSSHSEFGSASEELEVETEGDPVEIGFNAQYFLQVLGVLDDDQIKLQFSDALGPCLVRPASTDDALFVIMPMRLE